MHVAQRHATSSDWCVYPRYGSTRMVCKHGLSSGRPTSSPLALALAKVAADRPKCSGGARRMCEKFGADMAPGRLLVGLGQSLGGLHMLRGLHVDTDPVAGQLLTTC